MDITITQIDVDSSKTGASAIEKALKRKKFKFKFVGVYFVFFEPLGSKPQLMSDELRDWVDDWALHGIRKPIKTKL